VAEAGLVHVAGRLLQALQNRRGHGPVVLQLRRAGEGIGRYRRGSAPIASPPSVAIVPLATRHLRGALLVVVWLRRRVLVGIRGVWHGDGTGGRGDGCEYLSHLVPGEDSPGVLDRDRRVHANGAAATGAGGWWNSAGTAALAEALGRRCARAMR
jgi:hypothetical protein